MKNNEKTALRKMSDKELNSWLFDLEMTDSPVSYNKYRDTIRKIRAEIERRQGRKKVRNPRPRKYQEIPTLLIINANDEFMAKSLEESTVKAINDFLKKTGLKIKRSLRKAEKIAAITEWRKSFRNMSSTEKFETIKAGKIDKEFLLQLCGFDTLIGFARVLNIPEKSGRWYLSNDELTSKIVERLAA